ncbi:MAG TPA: hypothetical protein VK464_10325 [Symbiobacteriaceae bacterium]|jgi:uncharacterized membrane protein|nr:hypothetical protein [Symbiobacteriaceae bacterium]
MNESTRTERIIAAVAHVVSLVAVIPYFVGYTLIPSGPIWVGGLALNAGITLAAWTRSPYVTRHAAQAALWVLAAYLTEVLAFLFFVVAVLFGVGFSLRDGTFTDGALAGYNAEVLARVALALVFFAIPCCCAYQAFRGRACRVPLIGFVVGLITPAARQVKQP